MTSLNPLQDACDQIAAVVATVEGIRTSSGTPASQISVYPFAAVYISEAPWEATRPNGMMTGVCMVDIDLHLSMKDPPRDVTMMNRLHYGIVNNLFASLKHLRTTEIPLMPALQSINKITAKLSVFTNGAGQNLDTYGYKFACEVKIQVTIT